MSRLTSVVEGWICINPEDNDCPTMHYCECCDISVRNCLYFSNAIAKLKEYEDLEEQLKKLVSKHIKD